jgi:folate-binding Fe-S cluster repair protein YgfZ
VFRLDDYKASEYATSDWVPTHKGGTCFGKSFLVETELVRVELTSMQLWRPFELRDADEDTISRQRQEAKETIAKEESEFENRWRQREQEDESIRHENETAPEESNEPSNERQADTSQDIDKDTSKQARPENREAENGGQEAPTTDKREQNTDATHNLSRQDDEGEELMEEDKEDMVLY